MPSTYYFGPKAKQICGLLIYRCSEQQYDAEQKRTATHTCENLDVIRDLRL
jgi:hypothetical protein